MYQQWWKARGAHKKGGGDYVFTTYSGNRVRDYSKSFKKPMAITHGILFRGTSKVGIARNTGARAVRSKDGWSSARKVKP